MRKQNRFLLIVIDLFLFIDAFSFANALSFVNAFSFIDAFPFINVFSFISLFSFVNTFSFIDVFSNFFRIRFSYFFFRVLIVRTICDQQLFELTTLKIDESNAISIFSELKDIKRFNFYQFQNSDVTKKISTKLTITAIATKNYLVLYTI